MEHSFNPNPIIRMMKIFALAIIFSAGAFYFRTYIEGILYSLIYLVWIIAAVYMILIYSGSRFEVVTLGETSVKHTIGLLSQRNTVLPYAKITEKRYDQTLLERLVGLGTMHLDTAGGSAVAVHMLDVKKSDFKKVMEAVEKGAGKVRPDETGE